jgi:SAM-dependent methyltransferase
VTCCDHCADAEDLFSRRAARRDLRRYRRKGPSPLTGRLLEMLRREEVPGRTLIDIGGGIGAIQHELFKDGLASAVQVDASAAYLAAAREEAARQGNLERAEYHHGDFVDLAAGLDNADLVTLDRVVCCYPDMPRLVAASTSRARRLYALSYPRPRRGTRLFMAAANLFFRLRRSAFRIYLHPPPAIDAEIRRQGLRPVARVRTLLWEAALYRREGGGTSETGAPAS